MSSEQTRIEQIERQMLIDRNATNTLLNSVDRIDADIRSFRSEVKQEFAGVHQDLRIMASTLTDLQTQQKAMAAQQKTMAAMLAEILTRLPGKSTDQQ